MSALGRRDFLKLMGGGACGVCAFTEADELSAMELVATMQAELEAAGDLSWGKAPCRFCGTGCGVMVGVRDKKVVAVRGDEASPVNKGLLCVKGYHLPGLLYGEDRLRHPMLRKKSGKGFERITWDRALDLIALKFQESLDSHGPDSVAMYGSGQWTIHDGYVALKWVKAGLRSNNLDSNARLCMASAVMGFMTQFGSDEPMGCYEDFEQGDDFILWGNNMAEMHPVLFSRILENKRKNTSVRIIDIATRQTPTSDYADLRISVVPGTDLALANGILHLLVENQKVDEAFIAENVVFKRGIEDLEAIGYGVEGKNNERYDFKDEARASSFAEFTSFLADYSPDKVEKLTGVPAQQIKALAEIYGDQKRGTVSLWCMGVNQHIRGTWMNNLLNNLHLVTGKISRPGNNPFSLTGQPSACGTAREVGTLSNRLPADMLVTKKAHREKTEKLWGLEPGTLPAKPGYHAIDMFRAFARGDVRCMWVQVTNPAVSFPNLARFNFSGKEERAGSKESFLVVSDIYPTPTTDLADLILPSAAWVEREGCFGNSERRTQHWEQLVPPPGEAKEDAWQIVEVAKRMGMGSLFPWPEAEFHEALYEEYRKFTIGVGKDLASYRELKNTRGMIWPVVNGKETRYRYAAGFDPYVKKDKGVHFYKAKKFGEKAAVWLRPYHPPAEVPDADYPFWLSTGRVLEHWHTGSMTRRIKELHQAVPNAYVEVNELDANKMGIKSGDKLRIVSRRGSLELEALVNGRGKPNVGSVFVPFFDESKLVNILTLDAMDNISKEPDYKKCAVRIERV